ncbi:hypothetical protein C8A00DRAFT_10898 [Chaetomidium leptoderma]|uniref:Uncharacterized protein n=1 Tax=Chaetomidium leptoderma TaxID=669021 RepID=A0AAN6VXL1_9PEZI|nr:hypothetical protein C8A00DRAFT_10898 [Chaetomidium leptoderma]
MSQQSSHAGDAMSEDVPVAQHAAPARATATTSGRGRGRGRWARTKNPKVTKPAQQKAPAGRGRRHKVYDSVEVQAAHERTQELKQAFSAVVKLVKPAIQEIADRTIINLFEDPAAYKRVPEYDATKKFLRERHEDSIQQCNDGLQHGLAMVDHVWKAQHQKVIEEYTTKAAELCEDRYGQLLRQLDTLEYLYDNGLPVDEITEEDANCQGVFYQTEGGVEVPHSGKTISELLVKPKTLALDPKRKADGQPEGQPAPKVAAAAKGDDAVPQMPRHPAGLLGAAEAIEESGATTPDSGSNAPTPTPAPEPAEETAPERAVQRAVSGAVTPADGPELPVPRGATAPDEHGVRLIWRRPTRMDAPNNRIMVPNFFDWDDLDIGFRDSTNCAQKGATKQRRGKYLGKPGSNYLFIDRRAGIWDSTIAAGELDDDLVKKHNLHPAHGLVLPGSVNEWEPPKPTADGWKPVVFRPPNGEEPIHASRTIEAARMDEETAAVERRMEVAQLVRTICEQEGIPQEDVAPDPELVERNRAEILAARGIDPAQVVVQPEPLPPAAPEPAAAAEDMMAAFAQFADHALDAAAAIEADEDAARMAAAKRTQTSRPYDAIRDVFTENPPARPPSPPPAVQETSPTPMAAADTASLSYLADVADLALPLGPAATQPAPVESVSYNQPPPPPPNEYIRLGEYELAPAEYPQPELAHYARPDGLMAPVEPARTNDFLRTALNPPPLLSLPPSMPPVQEYMGVPGAPTPGPTQAQQTTAGRTPFTNTGAAKALPALRPMRGLLNESSPFPEPQGSQAQPLGNMVASNSGAYFPPAANRPFHNGYPPQEQMQSMQQSLMLQQSLGNPLQAPPLACPPMGPAPLRRMSTPPPYHQHAGPSALGPAPVPLVGAQAPIHFQGGQQPLAPAVAPAPRSRPGSSSAANNSAASSKYRKLEPAPTPPHRLSYSGSGQELRTVQFDYREAIRDYAAVEAPPRHGPTQIRGWTHNNIKKTTRPAPAGGGGGADTSARDTVGKKGGSRKRARVDDGEGAPRKKVNVAGPIHSPAPSPFVPIAPREASNARFPVPTPTPAPTSSSLIPLASAAYRAAAISTLTAAANPPAPNTKTKKSRARSATPAPPGRSPYNLRSRRGAKDTDTNTEAAPVLGSKELPFDI